MLILDADTTRNLLSHADCVHVMDTAMRALSSGEVDAPVRQVIPLGDRDHFFVMPGALKGGPVYGAKLVNLVPDNPRRGLPNVQGFIVLFGCRRNGQFDGRIGLNGLQTALAVVQHVDRFATPGFERLHVVLNAYD